MSLPGQSHPHSGPGWGGAQHTPHETTAAPKPPPPPGVQLPRTAPTGPVVTNGGGRRRFPGGSLTIAALPFFLLPDDDPWEPERWRRLGEPLGPGGR